MDLKNAAGVNTSKLAPKSDVANLKAKDDKINQLWPSKDCECEFDKSCDVRECLDYENCKCRKIDNLISSLMNVVKILMEMKWFIMQL